MDAPIRRREPAVAPAIEARPSNRSRDRANPALSGDGAVVAAVHRRSLEPSYIPGPPTRGNLTVWAMILWMFIVLGLSALIACAWVLVFGAKQTGNEASQDLASPSPIANTSIKPPDVKSQTAMLPLVRGGPAAAMDPPRATEAATVPATNGPSLSPTASLPASKQPPRSTEAAVLAADEPRPTANQFQPPAKTAPIPAPQSDSPGPVKRTEVLDDSQITMLIRRGKDFLTNGDFVSARLLLNRAADAGSAEAALTLGSTFDPFVIQRLGAVAIKPDIDRARKWYQRAAELGSAAASQQLANLARAR
jgi:hypothetical protein